MTDDQPSHPNISERMSNYKLKAWQRDDEDEIDTQLVATKLCRELKRSSIPQAVFAHQILCRSQGTLSDLLRNPKPWNQLKSGRETFRRMWSWLQLPETERLRVLHEGLEQRTKQSSSPGSIAETTGEHLSTLIKQENEEILSEKESSESESKEKRARLRTTFTTDQRHYLNTIFIQNPKPLKHEVANVANRLNLKPATVANFFANARQRYAERTQAHPDAVPLDYSNDCDGRSADFNEDSIEAKSPDSVILEKSEATSKKVETKCYQGESSDAKACSPQPIDYRQCHQKERYKFVLYNSVESRDDPNPSENDDYTYFIKEESPDEDFN